MAVVMLMVASARAAHADAVVRFVNGREIVVREHWEAGSRLLFSHKLGTIGVPREFVAAILPLAPSRKIGGTPEAVNATPLVAVEPFR
jgi:hypothetical protein